LLAAGGDLSTERLLDAYRHGIFPWFSEGDPILWWSPDPRMILFPAELKISRSLGKTLRNRSYEARFDSAFDEVVGGCAAPRKGEPGTWISGAMIEAYRGLHRLGYAHSVEPGSTEISPEDSTAWRSAECFSASRCSPAPAMPRRSRSPRWLPHLESAGFGLIDCQMRTPHLETLGAREIPRRRFSRLLEELIHYPHSPGSWSGASVAQVQCRS